MSTIKNKASLILKKLLRGKDASEELSAAIEITLAIKMNSEIIARLYFDKDAKEFCLTYTDKFKSSGLTPFHVDYNNKTEDVDTEKVYKNKILWYPLALRLPNPERTDYSEALNDAGLTGNESPLEIIGRLSNYSISKPWKFEVIKGEKNSA